MTYPTMYDIRKERQRVMELDKFTNYSNNMLENGQEVNFNHPPLCASNLARGDANGESKQLVEPYI